MIYWAYVVIVLHAVFSVKADSHKQNFFHYNSTCQYVTDFKKLECCKNIVYDYYTKFELHNRYLTTFLESLQALNCTEFKQQCERRTFNYTEFTSLIYLRFCNRSQMEAQCYDDILNVVTKQNNGIQIKSEFNQLVSKLYLIPPNEEDLMNPCVQVAMYDGDSGNQSHYHEIIEPIVPLCSYVWCGFDESLFTEKYVAPWTCMPSR